MTAVSGRPSARRQRGRRLRPQAGPNRIQIRKDARHGRFVSSWVQDSSSRSWLRHMDLCDKSQMRMKNPDLPPHDAMCACRLITMTCQQRFCPHQTAMPCANDGMHHNISLLESVCRPDPSWHGSSIALQVAGADSENKSKALVPCRVATDQLTQRACKPAQPLRSSCARVAQVPCQSGSLLCQAWQLVLSTQLTQSQLCDNIIVQVVCRDVPSRPHIHGPHATSMTEQSNCDFPHPRTEAATYYLEEYPHGASTKPS